MSTITKKRLAFFARVSLLKAAYAPSAAIKAHHLAQAQHHIKALRNRLYQERLARAVNSFPTSIRLGGFY